jgi:hypothetical protein
MKITLIPRKGFNLRSRRQHKAWGEAKRNPRIGKRLTTRAREAGDSLSKGMDLTTVNVICDELLPPVYTG